MRCHMLISGIQRCILQTLDTFYDQTNPHLNISLSIYYLNHFALNGVRAKAANTPSTSPLKVTDTQVHPGQF